MSTALEFSSTFRDTMRERILSSLIGLMPKEKIDELVASEVRAFFETSQLLTVSATSVEVDNPQYSAGSGYHQDRKIKKECLAFGSKMTPFRQLVWSTLHAAIEPQLQTILTDNDSELKVDLGKWLLEKAKPDLTGCNKELFNNMVIGMAAVQLRNTMLEAMNASHMNLRNALGASGFNTANMPEMMVPYPPAQK